MNCSSSSPPPPPSGSPVPPALALAPTHQQSPPPEPEVHAMATSAALVFAGKSVATPAISFLVNKAFTYLNEYRKAEDVAEMKDRILGLLDQIQAVFDVVNPERIKGESRALDAWLWKLRDAVEKAEDALDEVEYYELKKKAKDEKVSDWGSTFDKIMHNAIKSVKETTIVDKAIKGLTHRSSLMRLRKALEGLDKAAAGVADFVTLAERLNRCTSQQKEEFLKERETSSKLAAPQVFGRNKEKELLIGWLTANTSCEDTEIKVSCSNNPLSLVSIVGHGGMGKTTLAQLICQEDSVRKHFEIVIWACVSTSFDATTVTIKILESATWATPNAVTLEALHKILEEKVKSVKFLLILDDVWDDNKIDQWEKLFAPLRSGKSGSKILLTTRMQSVANLAAKALGCQNKYLPLEGLNGYENIMLFNHHAFPKEPFQDYTALQPLGEQIAKNLRGCPLVTKVVASHLRDHLSFQYWNDFLNQRLEHSRGTAEDVMNVLKLSYYHLPTEMQTCFRYCSIFPQDFEFDKAQLVKMWVSSGLISQVAVGSESPMSIGEQYLDQLTRKSFFEVSSGKEKYVMHDLMHDLATYVSLGECTRIVDVASLENVASTVRHMYIGNINDLLEEKIMEITHLKKLRTIIVKGVCQKINKVTLNIVEQLVESSKSLRLLETELGHTSHFIGKLALQKHLRFLELQWIPRESICGVDKLYHLTTLRCRLVQIDGKQLIRDVMNIEAHVNLMELCVSNCSGTRIPRWAEKLVDQKLVCLELKRFESCEQLKLENLLELKNIGQELFWPSNLRRLEVRGCPKLKELALEKLLTLQELWLENLHRLKQIGQELDVSGYERTELFWPPHLGSLKVRDCPSLKGMPLLPPTLRRLDIEEVGLTKLPRMKQLNNGNADRFQSISISVESCQSLTSLEGSLFEQKQCMRSLTTLCISDCVQLESAHLPFEEMKKLELISISNCPKLRTLRGAEDKLPPSSTSSKFGWSWTHASIVRCESLSSLGGLESLPFLISLEIKGCSKLAEAGRSLNLDVSGGGEEHLVVPRSSREIIKLRIDHSSLLLIEPLNKPCNTSHLIIFDGSEMESIPEGWLLQNRLSLKSLELLQAKYLESLPSSLRDLSSLEKLRITSAGKLRSLPDLPSSLKELYLSGCHWELGKKFGEFGSPERNKICNVQRAKIGIRAVIHFLCGQTNKETIARALS